MKDPFNGLDPNYQEILATVPDRFRSMVEKEVKRHSRGLFRALIEAVGEREVREGSRWVTLLPEGLTPGEAAVPDRTYRLAVRVGLSGLAVRVGPSGYQAREVSEPSKTSTSARGSGSSAS